MITTLTDGNEALRQTIESPTEENLQELEALWADNALRKVEAFALDTNERYNSRPFTVQLDYIRSPSIQSQISTRQVLISTRERWTYSGPTTSNEEAFDFIYTLSRRGDNWIITNFTFRNLATPTPTSTVILIPPRRPTMTSTPSPTGDGG